MSRLDTLTDERLGRAITLLRGEATRMIVTVRAGLEASSADLLEWARRLLEIEELLTGFGVHTPAVDPPGEVHEGEDERDQT